MNLIKQLICKHEEYEFIRNIYGDEINYISPINKIIRSLWKCIKCDYIKGKESLRRTYE